MTKDEERAVKRKVRILKYADELGNISKACRYFGIPRSIFYVWRNAYRANGEESLRCKKPIPKNQPNRTPIAVAEKVLYLRRKYHLGPIRIIVIHKLPFSNTTNTNRPGSRVSGKISLAC